MGFSMMAIPEPTETTLHEHEVIGLYFSADWCQQCSVFTPVLERLYSARRARGADQCEVVLVSRCREAKATKYYREDMPWLSMEHEADDEAGTKAHTASLMAKFGITSIPALVLLDNRGGLMCADARDKCVADPEGWAFPWRKQSQSPATARTAGRGPVVNFDLPPRARLRPEPTCARPQAFAGGSTVEGLVFTTTRGTALGLPVGVPVGKRGGAVTTTARTRAAALGSPVGFPVGERIGPAITMLTEAAAPPAHGGNETRVRARRGMRKSLPSDEVVGLPPDGGQPPSFAEDKHEMARYDSIVIEEDLARLAEARIRAPRVPAAPADMDHNIRRPPADIHSRARRTKDAQQKKTPDIVDAGLTG